METINQRKWQRLRRYMTLLNNVEDEALLDAVDTLVGDLMAVREPKKPHLVLVKNDSGPVEPFLQRPRYKQ